MIYFKQIEQNVKRISRELQAVQQGTDESVRLQQQYNALQEILTFIRKGTWISTTDGFNRVMDTLRYGIADAAEKYKCSENTIRVGLSKASAKVETLIGADVLPEILNGNVDLAMFHYKRNTKQLNNVLLLDAFETVANETAQPTDVYNLNDCKAELGYMLQHSTARAQKQQETLDKNKLRYLYKLLTAAETPEEEHKQLQLYNYLQNNTAERR